MKYYSRRYLNEKWKSLKWDIEKVLQIENVEIEDSISYEDIQRVLANVLDKMEAIRSELDG